MLRLGIFIAALTAVFIAALSLTPRLLTPNVYRAQALVVSYAQGPRAAAA